MILKPLYVGYDHGFGHFPLDSNDSILKPTNVTCDHGLGACDYDLVIVLVILFWNLLS